MNETDISKALGQHLQSLADVPYIVWPNKDKPASVARPYLVVQVVRVSRRAPDLKNGDAVIARGLYQVTVVAALNKDATDADALAGRIAAHFPKAKRLTENGGTVTILDAPDILPAMRDGSDWRVPVHIDYEAS